jgi:hypothetical protein
MPYATTAGGFARDLFDVGDRRTCKACGARVDVDSHMSDSSREMVITAKCHGATAEFRFDPSKMSGMPRDSFATWAENLFAADCNPDVMELLRYNRAGWPS